MADGENGAAGVAGGSVPPSPAWKRARNPEYPPTLSEESEMDLCIFLCRRANFLLVAPHWQASALRHSPGLPAN
jgi:hypothetical protein